MSNLTPDEVHAVTKVIGLIERYRSQGNALVNTETLQTLIDTIDRLSENARTDPHLGIAPALFERMTHGVPPIQAVERAVTLATPPDDAHVDYAALYGEAKAPAVPTTKLTKTAREMLLHLAHYGGTIDYDKTDDQYYRNWGTLLKNDDIKWHRRRITVSTFEQLKPHLTYIADGYGLDEIKEYEISKSTWRFVETLDAEATDLGRRALAEGGAK